MLVMTNMISIGLMIITIGMIYLLLRYFGDIWYVLGWAVACQTRSDNSKIIKQKMSEIPEQVIIHFQ